jgi:type II secretory pathway component GspD/PulD (secretin)
MIVAPLLLGLLSLTAAPEPVAEGDKTQEVVAAPAVTKDEADAKQSQKAVAEVEREADVDTPDEKNADKPLSFNFRHTPWKDVLPWFADKADLSLEMTDAPKGTLNYLDNRKYSVAEGMDILNELLQIRGYTLIRRERLLMVINLEDEIPANLIPIVALDDLDQRGKHEIVSVLFKLEKLTTEQAQTELKAILGPQGKIVVLPTAQQLMVTDSVWRMKTVRDVVDSIENPNTADAGPIAVFETKYVSPLEAISMIRQLMDFPEDKNVTADGGLRIAVDPVSGKLLASGRGDLVKRVRAILETIDTPGEGAVEGGAPTIETPQVLVYGTGGADPNTVLSVLQTMFSGATDMNLALDPTTGSLIARAKPSQHATIRATIDELSGESKQVDVFKLSRLDPQLAVLSINKLFATTGENAAANAPKVDADPNTRQLMVRGSKGQVEEIRKWLEKMGEVQAPGGGMARSNERMRMIPLTGRAQRLALEQLEAIWPRMRANQIRVVTPSAIAPNIRSMNRPEPGEAPSVLPNRLPAPRPEAPSPTDRTIRADENRSSAAALHKSPFQLVNQQTELQPEPEVTAPAQAEAPVTEAAEPATEATPTEPQVEDATAPKLDSPIIVSPGPGGIMIASDDTEALDALEEMLSTLSQQGTTASGKEYTVFYLQNASATTAAQTLASILGGGTGGGGGEGSLMGDLAGAAFGDMGGLMGNLMGMGGGNNNSGGDGQVVRVAGGTMIVPDMRLNALFVQASQANLEAIEQLLQVIDQPETPETQIAARPRISSCSPRTPRKSRIS